MAKKSVVVRARVERVQPRLPHPSWRQLAVGPEGERQDLTADDFWKRLGL